MKIRNGFVSNSSSSSFIMRATKFTADELIDALGIREKIKGYIENEEEYEIFDAIGSELPKGLDIEPTGNYFGDSDYENLIVGKSCGDLSDGEVVEIKEHTPETDEEIIELLKGIGLSTEGLRTYIQMISNDNY